MSTREKTPSSGCCLAATDNRNSEDKRANGSRYNNNNDHELMARLSCCRAGCCCCSWSRSPLVRLGRQRALKRRPPRSGQIPYTKPASDSISDPKEPPPPPPLQFMDYVFNSGTPLAGKAAPSLLSIYCFIILIVSALVKPSLTSVNTYYQNALVTQPNNKISGQYHISQLCSQRSPFPITRRVEGATLSSGPAADTDLNCTVTFRTKSAQQHFVIRFEELKLSCDDHLILFDGDLDYGQPSIKDFSCRDNMASVPIMKTTGTFLTMRYSSDGTGKLNNGFRLVVTAVFDVAMSDCPNEYVYCRSQLCISRSLICDGVNHCLDNSDEIACNGSDDAIELPWALGFFVMLILIIATGVIVCVFLHCRRDQSTPYDQYQHHLQRAFGGVPLQTSSSLMFAHHHHHQPQYQFFQPANVSPYMTPHHVPVAAAANAQQQAAAAMFATLPRGYSTLPLNLVRGQPSSGQQQTILAAKANHANATANDTMNMLAANHHQNQPQEYLMMAGLNGPHLVHPGSFALAPMQAAPVQQTSVQQQQQRPQNLTNSQSILSTSTTTASAAVGTNRLVQREQQQQQQQQRMVATPPSSGAQVASSNTLRERTSGSGL